MAYIQVDQEIGRQFLGAVKAATVSRKTGELSEFGKKSLAQIAVHMFGLDASEADSVSTTTPAQLKAACVDANIALRVLEVISIATFIEGLRDENDEIIPQKIDAAKLKHALEYANALSIDNDFIELMQLLIDDKVEEFKQKYTRLNFESVFHVKYDKVDDTAAIAFPYKDSPDKALLERYHSLQTYPEGSLGKAFWQLYTSKEFKFPGDPEGLVEAFAAPHDSLHILAGYNTKFSGEILVSTCTATMHDVFPVSGHVFIVAANWNLGFISTVAINLKAVGCLVIERFWEAYACGAAMKVNTFDPSWDFWAAADKNLDDLRLEYGIPPFQAGGKAGLM